MTPYNDGMTNFESAKQAAMIEWNQIKDQIKETKEKYKDRTIFIIGSFYVYKNVIEALKE